MNAATSEQPIYRWITETGADDLRAHGLAVWTAPNGKEVIWTVRGHVLLTMLGRPAVGPNGDSAVCVCHSPTAPVHYEHHMADSARYLAEETARLILKLDEALTAAIEITGVGEEIGTHGALRAMYRRRLGERDKSGSFADWNVQRPVGAE